MQIEINFMTQENAKSIISTEDNYIKDLTDKEIELRMFGEINISKEKYLDSLKDSILKWEESDINRITKIFKFINLNLKKIIKNETYKIKLIKTNGKDEWNSAYTRNDCIFIPQKKISTYTDTKFERLLVHEIFHIVSTKDKTIRNALYEILGYQIIQDISINDTINKRILTNPDTVGKWCTVTGEYNLTKIKVTPIVALKDNLNIVNSKFDIVNSIDVLFLKIEDNCGIELIPAKDIKIEEKTVFKINGRIEHPEEIIAEYFVEIVLDKNYTKDGYIEEMYRILIKH